MTSGDGSNPVLNARPRVISYQLSKQKWNVTCTKNSRCIGSIHFTSTEGFKFMGLGRIAEAGVITWLFGGGVVMFLIVFLLLKAC